MRDKSLGPLVERQRRKAERVAGGVALAVGTVLLILDLIAFAPHDSAGDRVGGITLFYSVLVVGVLVGTQPRLDIRRDGLYVVNWLFVYVLPWASVRSARVTNRLIVDTTTGTTVKPSIGSDSVVSAVRGLRLQNQMAERINAVLVGSRREPPGAVHALPERRWNPTAMLLLNAYLLLVVVVVLAF